MDNKKRASSGMILRGVSLIVICAWLLHFLASQVHILSYMNIFTTTEGLAMVVVLAAGVGFLLGAILLIGGVVDFFKR